MKTVRTILIAISVYMAIPTALAHPMPESRVWVDTRPEGLHLSLQLPLDRLEIAYGKPLADTPQVSILRENDGLARYLLLHIGARSGSQGWQALRPRLHVEGKAPSAELVADMDLLAPPGSDPRSTRLLIDAIIHEIKTHRMLVFLRNDWAAGQIQAPVLLGEIHYQDTSIKIELPHSRIGSSFLSLWKAGLIHIAEGTDHLLFLTLLLLVAPLRSVAGRWQNTPRPHAVFKRLTLIVSAFTLGHFITLTLGSSGLLVIEVRWIETAVAATIFIAAIHALRPLFSKGDARMALALGLIHGMAFSESLSGAGLTIGQHAIALLAFNLGIETMQLLVLLAVMPALILIAKVSPLSYARLRVGTAVVSAAIAAHWTIERAGFNIPATFSWLGTIADHLYWFAGAVWLVAIMLLASTSSFKPQKTPALKHES